MTPPIPADAVDVREGLEASFRRRHRRDGPRARDAWRALVAKRSAMMADCAFGPIFQPPRLPDSLKGLGLLRVVKGLPHGFRAVYSVFRDPTVGLVVCIDWIGDHQEYDKAFGYATS